MKGISSVQVYVRRAMNEKTETGTKSPKPDTLGDKGIPRVRKSKLLIVDLAGSERINKSGLNSFTVHITTLSCYIKRL